MTRLELTRVSGRKLRRVDLSLDPGLHALLGGPEDEAAELVAICAGIVRPKKGTVRLNGQRPFQSPDTRRAIGALLDVEEPFEGSTVEASVSRALAVHRCRESARDVLAPLGLESFLCRPPASLSALEVRSVALSIALGLEAPLLLVLHEPFAAGLVRRDVEARLADHAARGTIVLSIMASVREAAEAGARPVGLRPLPRRGQDVRS